MPLFSSSPPPLQHTHTPRVWGEEQGDNCHFGLLCKFCLLLLDAMKDDASCPKTSYEANIGDSVALCCPVSGNPPPEVEWTFDDMKVKESLATNLAIPSVKESNYGSYYCTARSLEKAAGPFTITLNKTECKLLGFLLLSGSGL